MKQTNFQEKMIKQWETQTLGQREVRILKQGEVKIVKQEDPYQAIREQFLTLQDWFMTNNITEYELLNNTWTGAYEEFMHQKNLQRPHNHYDKLPSQLDATAHVAGIRLIIQSVIGEGIDFDETSPLQPICYALLYLAVKWQFVGVSNDYNYCNGFKGVDLASVYKKQLEEDKRNHYNFNNALYLEPEQPIFERLFADKLAGIRNYKIDHRHHPELDQYYQEILRRTGDPDESGAPLYTPHPQTVKRFGELIEMLFESFYDLLPDQDKITAPEAADILNRILGDIDEAPAIDSDQTQTAQCYIAVLDPVIGNISVNHQERVIRIPRERIFGRTEFKRLVLSHELGVHILRALRFKDTELSCLSQGLPGSEEFEEGLATCVEQALAGVYAPSRMERYIGIGLAHFRNLNFRDTFEVMWRLDYLSRVLPNLMSDTEKAALEESCKQRNFNETQRIFRGTGELVNFKDLMYYRGNIQVWQYIESHLDDPEQLLADLFLTGKINALDPRQKKFVTQDIYQIQPLTD